MNRLYVIILLFLTAFQAKAQETYGIRGVVLAENKSPIARRDGVPGKYYKGYFTDAEGKFELNSLQAGGYKLIVSFIGYQARTITIRIPENKTFTISLNLGVHQLNEVVITDKRMRNSDWLDNLETFKHYFIGRGENAKRCFILNERALSFKKSLLVLEASADSLLLIQNETLGYSLKFLLEKFRYDPAAKKIAYKGHTIYTPLVPRNNNEKVRWATNRLKSYYGSEMHFIRALYRQRLIEEGFFYNLFKDYLVGNRSVNKAIADTVLLRKSKLFKRSMRMPTIWGYDKILDSLSSNTNHMIAFNGQLEVVYIHEKENYGFTAGKTIPQKSRIILFGPRVKFEQDGQVLNDEESLMTQGHWSWELVSESLPYDYDPADDLSVVKAN